MTMSILEKPGALPADDRLALACCEAAIERGFEWIGAALTEIRDRRLYRLGHGTFEEYCQRRWRMARQHADRLITSARILADLTPIGVKPQTESQVRPLALLAPESRSDAWNEAAETAPEGKVTAKHVEAVVRRKLEGSPKRQDTSESLKSGQMSSNKDILAIRRKHELKVATNALRGIRSTYRHLKDSELAGVFREIDALGPKPRSREGKAP